MTTYPIRHLDDAVRLFHDHPVIATTLRHWLERHRAYIRGGFNVEEGIRVLVIKLACLKAIARCGDGTTFVVDEARRRGLDEETFPPGCGPYDMPDEIAA